jgi:toxin-antitoxin system PIN domain toxin
VIIPDVNILLYAFADEVDQHAAAQAWLDETLASGTSVALADAVISGVVRISTNRKTFRNPSTPEAAIEFIDKMLRRANVKRVGAGERHWTIFSRLVMESRATGDLVSDAHLGALAIEHGGRLATTDRDFLRFPAVDWFDPLS